MFRIEFSPREYCPNCYIRDCPYIHIDCWYIYNDDDLVAGPFYTEQDAKIVLIVLDNPCIA